MKRMTQPPENMGGQFAGDQPPDGQQHDGQEAGSPASAPPPSSWYFPPEPTPSPGPAQPQAYGTPTEPYGGQPYSGQPYGGQPSPGPGPQHGAPGPHGGQQPFPPQQPAYGAPQQQPYGGPQQQYGAPQQPYGGPQQPYGAPQQYGPAYPSYPAGPGYQAGPEPDLAGRWRRLFARLIDGLVLSIVLIPLSIPLLSHPLNNLQQVSNRFPDITTPAAQAALAKADGKLLGAFAVFLVLAAVISFLYDWPQHARWGQTLGKRALHTRVVTAHGRSPINGATAAKRSAVYALIPVVPVIGGLFALLNQMWLLWDSRRQCLHDKVARTIVVRTDVPVPGAPQQPAPW